MGGDALPLPPLVRTLVEKKVEKFCDRRVPPHVQNKVRLVFKVRGVSVTIFEERAPWSEALPIVKTKKRVVFGVEAPALV